MFRWSLPTAFFITIVIASSAWAQFDVPLECQRDYHNRTLGWGSIWRTQHGQGRNDAILALDKLRRLVLANRNYDTEQLVGIEAAAKRACQIVRGELVVIVQRAAVYRRKHEACRSPHDCEASTKIFEESRQLSQARAIMLREAQKVACGMVEFAKCVWTKTE